MIEQLLNFLEQTGFAQMSWGNAIMIVIGIIFISLAIVKDYEPLLLLPIGFGILTCDTTDQARERCGGKVGNKGWEAAMATLEMSSLLSAIGESKESD